MALNTLIIQALRRRIGDTDSAKYQYQDSQLEDFLLDAATVLILDVGVTDYELDTSNRTLTPDPMANGPDWSYIELLLSCAALHIAQVEQRETAGKAGAISVGPRMAINTSAQAQVAAQKVAQFTKQYSRAKLAYRMKRANSYITGIT